MNIFRKILEKQDNMNKEGLNKILESQEMDLPLEIIKDLPLVTQVGTEHISIENYRGIIEYTESTIRVNARNSVIKISGEKLYLKQLTTEILVIKGIINKVEYMA